MSEFSQRGSGPTMTQVPPIDPDKPQGDPKVNSEGVLFQPLITRPERVCIVCLGSSAHAYLAESMTNHGFKRPFDEVWTLNRGVRGYMHDKLFVMDDLKWIEKNSPDYATYLKRHTKPIITSTAYPDFPMAVEYPYEQVLQLIGDDIFAVNTVSYMVAFAMAIGVKEISIYGADFFYPNGNTAEAGGQAVAYLLGRCAQYGIQFRVPNTSTLMYAHLVQPGPGGPGRKKYGYHRLEEMMKEEEKNTGRKAMKGIDFYA